MIKVEQRNGSLFETLKAQNPDKNVLYVAARSLEDPGDIEQFTQEYAGWLAENSARETAQVESLSWAGGNMAFVLGNFAPNVSDRWVNHLTVGPTIPWDRNVNAPRYGEVVRRNLLFIGDQGVKLTLSEHLGLGL